MEEIKKFIEEVIQIETDVLNLDDVPELAPINSKVEELKSHAIEPWVKYFEKHERESLKPDVFYKIKTDPKTPRYLYKVAEYLSPTYGNIWVAYLSYPSPLAEPKGVAISEAFIVGTKDDELKLIGSMSVDLSESDMKPTSWKGQIYNPSDLEIDNFGEFKGAERFMEPLDDGFSLKDYLADK